MDASDLRAAPGADGAATPDAEPVPFRCNVCGEATAVPRHRFGRETPSCHHCGSTVRVRSIVHALSLALHGQSLAIGEFPARPDLRGLGLGDWAGYAVRLAERLGYENTWSHREPRLDIRCPDPELEGTLDFLIATDVFEHVTPPVQQAFDAAFRLLKPGGVFVFSVPYTLDGPTIEHYPDLHDHQVEERQDGYVVLNRTVDGREQCFLDPVFHGVDGEMLEMRVFGQSSLLENFRAAGFEPPTVHAEDVPACGIYHEFACSLTWTVRRPRVPAEPSASIAPASAAGPVLFDQHSRYASVGDVLQQAARPGESVLDIGSGEARLLGRYAAGLHCSYLDPLLQQDEGPDVLAGGFSRLQDDTRQWDWVVAVDTLEHIPAARREAFVRTMLARSRVGVVLSGPCIEDEAAHTVDAHVNDAYRAKTGEDYPWLVEHRDHGLPARTWIEEMFRDAGLSLAVRGNGHAPWLAELLPLFVCYLDDPVHLPLLHELSAAFNSRLYRYDHLEPVYRRIVVGARRPLELEDDAPAGALREAAARTWRAFRHEVLALISRHADRLADAAVRTEAPQASPRWSELRGRLERAERQLAELRPKLVAEREHTASLTHRLERLEGSRTVRIARRLGLLRDGR